MSNENQWAKDSLEFASDLYFFLFTQEQRTYFSSTFPLFKDHFMKSQYENIYAKAVLYLWYNFRDDHRLLISKLKPEKVVNGREFIQYLESLCMELVTSDQAGENENIFMTVLIMSGQLFESCVYLLEKNLIFDSFVFLIPMAWSHLFGLYYKKRFFAEGGWIKFKQESLEYSLRCELALMSFPEDCFSMKKDAEKLYDFNRTESTDDKLDIVKLSRKLKEIRYKFGRQLEGKLRYEGDLPPKLSAVEPIIIFKENKVTEVQIRNSNSSQILKKYSWFQNPVLPVHSNSECDIVFAPGSEIEDDSRKETNYSSVNGRKSYGHEYDTVTLFHPLSKSLILYFNKRRNLAGEYLDHDKFMNKVSDVSDSKELVESRTICALHAESYAISLETVLLYENSAENNPSKMTKIQMYHYSLLFLFCIAKVCPIPDSFILSMGDNETLHKQMKASSFAAGILKTFLLMRNSPI